MPVQCAYSLACTVPAYDTAVGLQGIKDHLRIDHSEEDAKLLDLIGMAQQYIEDVTARQFVTATFQQRFRQWPDRIYLARSPVQAVSSIQYYDTAGTLQTLAASSYVVETDAQPGVVELAVNATWPSVQDREGAIIVTFTAGELTPATFSAATNQATVYGRTFSNSNAVTLYNSGGQLPSPLALRTQYYVVEASGSTLRLATNAGGAAIDLTDTGQGTHYLSNPGRVFSCPPLLSALNAMVGHWYENREAVNVGNIINTMPFLSDLINSYRLTF
jgi:uncharacterized phiE125 gp8 family phage protein